MEEIDPSSDLGIGVVPGRVKGEDAHSLSLKVR